MTTETTPPPESASAPHAPPKNKKWVVFLIVLATVLAGFGYEWRYSDDMEDHINKVNRDLPNLEADAGTGLVGSIQTLTERVDLSREIAETHEHVHTLKDQALAWKIKRAIQQSSTVAEAIGQSIAVWQESFSEHREGPSATVANSTTPAAPSTSTPVSTPPAEAGYWQVNHDTNPVTGVVTTIAFLKFQGKRNIIIRQIGKAPVKCYINTDEFLETVENMHTGVSTVQYRIDQDKPVRQSWSISDDNEALFYPGTCAPLIARLRSARTLAFEYSPADKIPQTVTFDVAGFPDAFYVPAASTRPHKAAANPEPPLPRCADNDGKLPCRTDIDR